MTNFATLASEARANLRDGNKFSRDRVRDATMTIGSRGLRFDADIHAAAYACLHFAMPTAIDADNGASNAEPARFLVASLPRGSRQKCLADWFEAHSNIRLKQNPKTKAWTCGIAKKDAKTFIPHDQLIEAARKGWSQPFFSPEEKTSGARAFDFGKRFASFLKSAEAALGDNDAAIVELKAFAERHKIALAKAA